MSSATWVVDSVTGSWRPARAPIKDILAEIPTCTFCEEKGHGEQDCHQANFGRALKRARDEMWARVDSTYLARPLSHGIDAKLMINLADYGSVSLMANSSSPPPLPKKRAKLFDIRPTWLRDLHHQMQVPKLCEGREEVYSATTYPPNLAKWSRGALFCQRRAEFATGQWVNWYRWHNDHYMPEEVELLPSPPSSPRRPVVEENPLPPPSTSSEELPPPHLTPAPRRGLLGPPPPPPVSPFTSALRAIEQSIAQQTARIQAGLVAGEVQLHLLPPGQGIKLNRHQAGERKP